MDKHNTVFFELRAALPKEEILTRQEAKYAREILEYERLWRILPLPKTNKKRFEKLMDNRKLKIRVLFSERLHQRILDGKEAAEILWHEGSFRDFACGCAFGLYGIGYLDQYEATHLKKWVKDGCRYPQKLSIKALFERYNDEQK